MEITEEYLMARPIKTSLANPTASGGAPQSHCCLEEPTQRVGHPALKDIQNRNKSNPVLVKRTKSFHLKYTKVQGKLVIGEVHFNRVPSRGLFGAGAAFHGLIEGNHFAVPVMYAAAGYASGGNAISGLMFQKFRPFWRPVLENYHRHRHAF